ncbi:MAG: prepilin peptidase [Candidatus Bathyarchaeota archaeon]|nr:prepilin peptidase [Candidatus Bathyarchaeota archaeon]
MIVLLLRLAVSSALLVYASACDVASREVSDWVWVLGIPTCVLLDGVDLYFGCIDLLSLVASLGVSFLLGYVLCVLGFYGGADGRALVLMAAAMPSYPPSRLFVIQVFPLPLFFIFLSSTLFSIIYPLKVFTLNVIDRFRGKRLLHGIEEDNLLKRLVLYVTARRVTFETLKAGLKYFPAETIVVEGGEARRTPIYFLHAEAEVDELVEQLEAHKELFTDGVLASPTIPMIVFQTAGFLVVNLILYWPF